MQIMYIFIFKSEINFFFFANLVLGHLRRLLISLYAVDDLIGCRYILSWILLLNIEDRWLFNMETLLYGRCLAYFSDLEFIAM